MQFSIASSDFEEGKEIPKNCGYDHGNKRPVITLSGTPLPVCFALIMDDPDAMTAVGKVWDHYLFYNNTNTPEQDRVEGKNSWGEIGYGGPAPPDKRHTYIFKAYALDATPDLEEGYSKKQLEDAMKGHIIEEAKLTGTYAP